MSRNRSVSTAISKTMHARQALERDQGKRQKINSILAEKPLETKGDKFWFVNAVDLPHQTAGEGLLGRVQDLFKKHPKFYSFIVNQLSPVRSTKRCRQAIAELLGRFGPDKVIVNYGSGPVVLADRHDIINVDLFPFASVDVVSETRLPFSSKTVDLLYSSALIEHVRDPQTAVAEMIRCLKPAGELFVYVPFIQPIHAAPHDYQRWTEAGLRELFKEIDLVGSGVGAGPASGFLWILQHFLADTLSLGNSVLKDFLLIVLMLTTFPLKYLDVFLEHSSRKGDIASGFFIHCKKPNGVEGFSAVEAAFRKS